MEVHLFSLSCALLAIVCSLSEAVPVPTHQLADGPDDVRWRLVSGLETAYLYTERLIRACDSEPLLSPSGELLTILTGVCELVEIQELMGKVHNGSDLHAILEQNVLDSCHWLNRLVAKKELSVSTRFLQLNDTCEVGETPRLSQYCLERRLASFYKNIYLPASNFYADSVVNHDIPMWLQSSVAEQLRTNILLTLLQQNLPCSS